MRCTSDLLLHNHARPPSIPPSAPETSFGEETNSSFSRETAHSFRRTLPTEVQESVSQRDAVYGDTPIIIAHNGIFASTPCGYYPASSRCASQNGKLTIQSL